MKARRKKKIKRDLKDCGFVIAGEMSGVRKDFVVQSVTDSCLHVRPGSRGKNDEGARDGRRKRWKRVFEEGVH